jgi:hypothetical protein
MVSPKGVGNWRYLVQDFEVVGVSDFPDADPLGVLAFGIANTCTVLTLIANVHAVLRVFNVNSDSMPSTLVPQIQHHQHSCLHTQHPHSFIHISLLSSGDTWSFPSCQLYDASVGIRSSQVYGLFSESTVMERDFSDLGHDIDRLAEWAQDI